jgi:hypothetical protein
MENQLIQIVLESVTGALDFLARYLRGRNNG